MSLLSKATKSVAAPLKKAASVVTSAAVGYAAGGSVGALTGTAVGVVRNTKTSKAAPLTLRSQGQVALISGAANIAAGAVLSGAHALAAGSPGVGFGTKIAAFGAKYAKAGLVAPLAQSALGFLTKKGVPAVVGAAQNGSDDVIDLVKNHRGVYDQAANVASRALPQIGGYLNKRGVLPPSAQNILTPPDAANVTVSQAGPGMDTQTLLIVALGIAALMYFWKKHKGR